MARRSLKYVVYAEDSAFTAQCLAVDIASEGDTEPEAIAHLQEALELCFADHAGSVGLTPSGPIRFGELVIDS